MGDRAYAVGMSPEPHDDVCEFAFPGPLRDRLVGAVLRGEKTATGPLTDETQVVVEWFRLAADG